MLRNGRLTLGRVAILLITPILGALAPSASAEATISATEPGSAVRHANQSTASSATDEPCSDGTVNCPTPSGDGYIYLFDPTSQTIVPVPAGSYPSEPDVEYGYAVTPACPLARPGDGINCTGAAQYCALAGSSGVHEDVWRRETAPVTTPWQMVGQVCTGVGPPQVPVDQVIQDVGEYERDHMPIPTANVQPAGVAIVNLPVLVSATQLGPQTMQVQQPVPGELVATPTYTWTFDDGGTATGPGTAYDGTDPRTDPAHYALHIYRAANEHASVTLTVTWNATFSVAGQTFPIPQLVMPPITTTFSVREAHSVLVSG
jgi:hypothetical protein